MTTAALGGLVIALIAALLFGFNYRRRLYVCEGRDPGYPIPTVDVDAVDIVFTSGPLGPHRDTEIWFVGAVSGMRGATSDREAWILAVLATRSVAMFEFGTASGWTAYLWARNSPPAAKVTTITLRPSDLEAYSHVAGDSAKAARKARDESTTERFLYTGTNVEPKVEQLFGDSKAFDPAAYAASMDLIFVDGSHAYSYVKNDTEKALVMARDGCLILWHDYKGPWGGGRDVYRYLNQLHAELPLVRIAGTSLVALRFRRA